MHPTFHSARDETRLPTLAARTRLENPTLEYSEPEREVAHLNLEPVEKVLYWERLAQAAVDLKEQVKYPVPGSGKGVQAVPASVGSERRCREPDGKFIYFK